jgi:hypothetical protein
MYVRKVRMSSITTGLWQLAFQFSPPARRLGASRDFRSLKCFKVLAVPKSARDFQLEYCLDFENLRDFLLD